MEHNKVDLCVTQPVWTDLRVWCNQLDIDWIPFQQDDGYANVVLRDVAVSEDPKNATLQLEPLQQGRGHGAADGKNVSFFRINVRNYTSYAVTETDEWEFP